MIASNYLRIREEIASTAIRCGRDPAEITLVAVSKQVDWNAASILYNLGQRDFAENRLPEAFLKQNEAPDDCVWHYIGNLQKNKIHKIVGKFALIHSVDSLELAQKFSKASEEAGVVTAILLQANTSGEISKQGFNPGILKEQFGIIQGLKGVDVRGLMTMAPLTGNETTLRECFGGLRMLRDELRVIAGKKDCLPCLSMGMSNDFKVAIEEGATIVRIGSALFQA